MSSDMTSLGAILVIGKLEGLTREVEGGVQPDIFLFGAQAFSVLCGRCGFPFPIAVSSLISPHFVPSSHGRIHVSDKVFDT